MHRLVSSPFHFSLKYLYDYYLGLFWLEYLALVTRTWVQYLGKLFQAPAGKRFGWESEAGRVWFCWCCHFATTQVAGGHCGFPPVFRTLCVVAAGESTSGVPSLPPSCPGLPDLPSHLILFPFLTCSIYHLDHASKVRHTGLSVL